MIIPTKCEEVIACLKKSDLIVSTIYRRIQNSQSGVSKSIGHAKFSVNKNKIELNQLLKCCFLTPARLVPDLTPSHQTLAKFLPDHQKPQPKPPS